MKLLKEIKPLNVRGSQLYFDGFFFKELTGQMVFHRHPCLCVIYRSAIKKWVIKTGPREPEVRTRQTAGLKHDQNKRGKIFVEVQTCLYVLCPQSLHKLT